MCVSSEFSGPGIFGCHYCRHQATSGHFVQGQALGLRHQLPGTYVTKFSESAYARWVKRVDSPSVMRAPSRSAMRDDSVASARWRGSAELNFKPFKASSST